MSSVYVLHLDPPYRHVRHYVGWAVHVKRRIAHHRTGRGARVVQVAVEAGSEVLVGRVLRGRDRTFERRMKQRRWGPLEGVCRVCCERAGRRPKTLRALRTATRARWPRVKDSGLHSPA